LKIGTQTIGFDPSRIYLAILAHHSEEGKSRSPLKGNGTMVQTGPDLGGLAPLLDYGVFFILLLLSTTRPIG